MKTGDLDVEEGKKARAMRERDHLQSKLKELKSKRAAVHKEKE